MKKPLDTAFFSVFVLIFISCSSPNDSNSTDYLKNNNGNQLEINWVGSDVVYGSSSQKRSLSILYFTDDVCADGDKMEKQTFLDSTVIVIINNFYNIARISTANDTLIHFKDSLMTGNELFKLYNLVGVPSMLILDSDNRYFGRIQANYYKPDSFLVILEYYKNKLQ